MFAVLECRVLAVQVMSLLLILINYVFSNCRSFREELSIHSVFYRYFLFSEARVSSPHPWVPHCPIHHTILLKYCPAINMLLAPWTCPLLYEHVKSSISMYQCLIARLTYWGVLGGRSPTPPPNSSPKDALECPRGLPGGSLGVFGQLLGGLRVVLCRSAATQEPSYTCSLVLV